MPATAPIAPPVSAPEAEFRSLAGTAGNLQNIMTVRNILMAGGAAFGGAAALRGLRGLGDTWAGTRAGPPKLPTRRQFVEVPIPRQPLPDERRKRAGVAPGPLEALAGALLAAKQAGAPAAPVPAAAPPPMPKLPAGAEPVGRVMNYFNLLRKPGGTNWGPGMEMFAGYGAPVLDKPWVVPAGLAAILGGAYAGHKLTDTALDASRNVETESELEAAKSEYEDALRPKSAAASDAIDHLYDTLEKAAGVPVGAADGYALAESALEGGVEKAALLGGLGGAYLGLAGLTAGAAGYGTYNWARAHAEDKGVNSALRERRERMFANGPPPFVATPVEPEDPVDHPVPGRLSVTDLRDRLRAALGRPKAAGLADSADGTLARFTRQKQQLAQQTAAFLGVQPDAKKVAKPQPAAPPPLPSVANPPQPPPAPGG